MKLSNSYFYTLRENVKDEDSTSGNLLVRAGMIKKSSSGIYMIMPMGKRVLKKIEEIVREEMDAAGAQGGFWLQYVRLEGPLSEKLCAGADA